MSGDIKAKESTNPKDRIGITKVPLHLVPLIFMAHTSLALLDGACKYGLWNWRSEKVAAMVYVAACMRHLMKWACGRDKDPSGVHELGHAAACLAIILDAEQNGTLIDDRSKMQSTPAALDALAEDVKQILRNHGRLPDQTTVAHVCGMTGYDPMSDPPCPACVERDHGRLPDLHAANVRRPVRMDKDEIEKRRRAEGSGFNE